MKQTSIKLDGITFRVGVEQRVSAPPTAPRLLVVSHVPNETTFGILERCVRSVARFTPEPHELWVIDNNSPAPWSDRVRALQGLNVALNRTDPLPRGRRGIFSWHRGRASQQAAGSYANATALEIGVRLIDPRSKIIFTMHQDTMPCRKGWLTHLRSKIGSGFAAAGVRMDTGRTVEGVLHILGLMVDGDTFRELELSFWPDLPDLDVGDRVTKDLRANGREVFACPNTIWQPELIDRIPEGSPLRHLHVDRAFDDDGHVIFLHLGRGVSKSVGRRKDGTSPQEWVQFADEHLLAP